MQREKWNKLVSVLVYIFILLQNKNIISRISHTKKKTTEL